MILPALVVLAAPTLEFKAAEVQVRLSAPPSGRIPFLIRNRTAKPIVVWHGPFAANHAIGLTDARGKPVARTALGKAAQADFAKGGPSRDKNAPFTLLPGQTDEGGTPPLGKLFVLRPGRFRLRVEYSERRQRDRLRIRSGPVVVAVSP